MHDKWLWQVINIWMRWAGCDMALNHCQTIKKICFTRLNRFLNPWLEHRNKSYYTMLSSPQAFWMPILFSYSKGNFSCKYFSFLLVSISWPLLVFNIFACLGFLARLKCAFTKSWPLSTKSPLSRAPSTDKAELVTWTS